MTNFSETHVQNFLRHVGAIVEVSWSCFYSSVINKAFQQVCVRKCFGSARGHSEHLAVEKLLMCLCFAKQTQRGWVENMAGMCKQNNNWVGLVRIPSEAGEIGFDSSASAAYFIRILSGEGRIG